MKGQYGPYVVLDRATGFEYSYNTDKFEAFDGVCLVGGCSKMQYTLALLRHGPAMSRDYSLQFPDTFLSFRIFFGLYLTEQERQEFLLSLANGSIMLYENEI